MVNAISRLLVPRSQSIKLQNWWPPLTSAPLPTLSSLFPRFLFSIRLRSLGPPSRLRQANFYFDCSPCRTSPLFEQCSVLSRSFLPRSLFTFASKLLHRPLHHEVYTLFDVDRPLCRSVGSCIPYRSTLIWTGYLSWLFTERQWPQVK